MGNDREEARELAKHLRENPGQIESMPLWPARMMELDATGQPCGASRELAHVRLRSLIDRLRKREEMLQAMYTMALTLEACSPLEEAMWLAADMIAERPL